MSADQSFEETHWIGPLFLWGDKLKEKWKKRSEVLFKELLLIIGIAAIWYGLYLIYPPVSYIIMGAGLVWFSYPKG